MIDPERIRRRLVEVWDALGDEVVRACSLTLLTVVDGDSSAAEVTRTLAELMPEHPCRAIVVHLEDGAADRLEADVEAQCWMPFGKRRQICAEQIVIRCSAGNLAEVPGVALPLIVPDLPVVVWCASRRAWNSRAFPGVARLASRVLVDSTRIAEAFGDPGVADLAWTRLTRWRALLAQAFENPLYRERLRETAGAVIHHEGPCPPTAWLFGGWLAFCLRWDAGRLRFQTAGGEGPGRFTGFELGSDSARICIRRTGDACGEVRLECQGLEPVLARVSLSPSTDLLLLAEELSIHASDPVYEESRARALRIAEMHHERPVV